MDDYPGERFVEHLILDPHEDHHPFQEDKVDMALSVDRESFHLHE